MLHQAKQLKDNRYTAKLLKLFYFGVCLSSMVLFPRASKICSERQKEKAGGGGVGGGWGLNKETKIHAGMKLCITL